MAKGAKWPAGGTNGEGFSAQRLNLRPGRPSAEGGQGILVGGDVMSQDEEAIVFLIVAEGEPSYGEFQGRGS